MGSAGVARVDAAAVRAVAREYEEAATLVDRALQDHLVELRFGGATAGRVHQARGDGLATAVDALGVALRHWSRAATEIAAALRTSADRYQEADARSADRVG